MVINNSVVMARGQGWVEVEEVLRGIGGNGKIQEIKIRHPDYVLCFSL